MIACFCSSLWRQIHAISPARHRAGVLVAILFQGLLLAEAASAASPLVYPLSRVTGFAAQGDVVAAGGPHDGRWVVASKDLVTVYGLSASGKLAAQGSFLAEGNVTAVALADVDGDGHEEIVTAVGETGSIVVSRWNGRQRTIFGEPRYAWGRISSLAAAATANGHFVVAGGVAGGIWTFAANGHGLEPVLSQPEYRGRMLFSGTGDVDADGQEELLAQEGSGQAVLFRWAGLKGWNPLWQNYPWGGVAGTVLADLQSDGKYQVTVASAQGDLSVYGYVKGQDGGGLQLRVQRLGVTGLVRGIVALREPNSARTASKGQRLGVLTRDGLLLFALVTEKNNTQLTETRSWLIPGLTLVYPAPRFPATVGGKAATSPVAELAVFADSTAAAVGEEPAESIRAEWISADGTQPVATHGVFGGRYAVALREVADQCGAILDWDASRHVATVTLPSGDGRVELKAEGGVALRDGRPVPEFVGLISVKGKLFLSAGDYARLFPTDVYPNLPRLLVRVAGRTLSTEELF